MYIIYSTHVAETVATIHVHMYIFEGKFGFDAVLVLTQLQPATVDPQVRSLVVNTC